jgi:hypothetical protein
MARSKNNKKTGSLQQVRDEKSFDQEKWFHVTGFW